MKKQGKLTEGLLLSEPELEGASLPEGIEVDETSAYFGITQSSDIVHQMMSMDRNQSITAFFGLVSEVVLKPGEFDFEEASKVLKCEGGEIYYLVSGHLGLMSFSDPLLHYLGLPNSLGEESPNQKPAITDSQHDALKRLADPMNMMKILAIAQATGGPDEVMKYYQTMAEILGNVEQNSSTLIDIADEFDAALDFIGHPIPISNLANSTLDISGTSVQETPKTNLPVAVQLPSTTSVETITDEALMTQSEDQTETASVPLPNQSVGRDPPNQEIPEPTLEENLTDRKAAKVTDDAFEGAFGVMSAPSETMKEAEILVDGEIINEPQNEIIAENSTEPEETPESEGTDDTVTQEPFVSAAEMFIQADSDEDGNLSVEELSMATGLSDEESAELHKSADKDDDGKMSLSEFIASPAAEKAASNLPRPVAPVRKPVNRTELRPAIESNPPYQQPIPPQNIQPRPIQPNPLPQPMNNPPQQYPPQPSWNQTVQPTIRSGVSCRGCGIGIDPFWRFCPVCGGQNLN